MKTIICAYGTGWLLLAVGFARGRSWSWSAMLAAAVGAVWYLPFGTVLSVFQIALLLAFRSRLR